MTSISWVAGDDGSAGKSWNPIRARDRETGKVGWFCTPVHDGCARCYAGGLNVLRGTGHAYAAQLLARHEFFLDEERLREPLTWRRPYRVFVCSMTDVDGPWVKREWRDKIRAVQTLTPRHTYIEFTKRPAAMRAYQTDAGAPARVAKAAADMWARQLGPGQEGTLRVEVARSADAPHDLKADLTAWPLPNVIAGPSCSQQDDFDAFMRELQATPLAQRAVSFEPLLGEIDVSRWLKQGRLPLHWAIIGLESGDQARERDVSLIYHLMGQLQAAGVRVFVKQLGSKPVYRGARLKLRDRRKGENPAEWPADLRVRQFPIGAPPVGKARGVPGQQELPL
jgi:protein gp37